MPASSLDAYPNVAIPAKVIVHRHAGPVHAQDGRDPERARQADVPDPGADRSGTVARTRSDAVRSGLAGRRLRASPILPRSGPLGCKGRPPRNERARHARSRAWKMSRSVTERAVALDDVTLALAGRLHGRADRSRWRRQVDACSSIIAGARQVQSGARLRARRRYGRRRRTAPRSARASPICRRDWARTFIRTSASARTSNSSAALFGQSRAERDWRIAELLHSTGLAPFADRAGEEAVGRHAAETRTVLLAHPRSRPPDPRRADDRRRSAVAAPVLGADRSHPFAPRRHERRRRHRLHGRGRALRLAHRHE